MLIYAGNKKIKQKKEPKKKENKKTIKKAVSANNKPKENTIPKSAIRKLQFRDDKEQPLTLIKDLIDAYNKYVDKDEQYHDAEIPARSDKKFNLKMYKQVAKSKNKLWEHYNIDVHNVDANAVLFYYYYSEEEGKEKEKKEVNEEGEKDSEVSGRSFIYARTINQGWRVIQRNIDYTFSKKIAENILSEDGGSMYDETMLFGKERKIKRHLKEPTRTDSSKPAIGLGFTSELRTNASVRTIPTFKDSLRVPTGKIAVNVTLSYIKFEKIFGEEVYFDLIEHLNDIVNDKEVKTTAGTIQCRTDAYDHCIQTIDDVDNLKDLENEMIKELSNCFYSKNDVDLSFEFSYKVFDDFYLTHEFDLYYEGQILCEFSERPSLSDIFNILSDHVKKEKDETFENILNSTKIAFEPNGKNRIFRKLMEFIEGDIYFDERIYWRLSTKWYILNDDYCRKTNEIFLNNLKDEKQKYLISLDDKLRQLPLPWLWPEKVKTTENTIETENKEEEDSNKKKTRKRKSKKNENEKTNDDESKKKEAKIRIDHEGIYNKKYACVPGYFVGDKLTTANIELFDILFTKFNVNGEPLHHYIYHVKNKFDGNARVGCAQVLDSMSLAIGALNSRKNKHLDNYYNYVRNTKEYKDKPTNELPYILQRLDNLKRVFLKKKCTFVYAVQTNKNLQNTNEFTDFSILFKKYEVRNTRKSFHLEKLIQSNIVLEKFSGYFKYIKNGDEIFKGFARGFGCKLNTSRIEISRRIVKMLIDEDYVDSQGYKINYKLSHVNEKEFINNFKKSKVYKWVFEKELCVPLFDLLGPYRTFFTSVTAKIQLNRVIELAKANEINFKICEILGGKEKSQKILMEQSQAVPSTSSAVLYDSGVSLPQPSDDIIAPLPNDSAQFKTPTVPEILNESNGCVMEHTESNETLNSSNEQQQNILQDSAYNSETSETPQTVTKKKTQRKKRTESTPIKKRRSNKNQQ